MQGLWALVDRLTRAQRQEVFGSVKTQASAVGSGELIESARHPSRSCPHRSELCVVRNGVADRLHRYKCRACGKNFNAQTGTPSPKLRHETRGSIKPGHWRSPRPGSAPLRNHDGLRAVGHSQSRLHGRSQTAAAARYAVVCTGGGGSIGHAVRGLGLEHHRVGTSSGTHAIDARYIQDVSSYHGRFKGWMRRFNGVTTADLETYCGRFRALDRTPRSPHQTAQLLNLAMGVSSHHRLTRKAPFHFSARNPAPKSVAGTSESISITGLVDESTMPASGTAPSPQPRSSRRRILPTFDFGNSSRNSTCLGRL